MMDAVDVFADLKDTLASTSGGESGQMFGKPCLKVGGKAFAEQHLATLSFKLSGASHADALAVDGATFWDPSGKGRPMKEWVAIPAASESDFRGYAVEALNYVKETA